MYGGTFSTFGSFTGRTAVLPARQLPKIIGTSFSTLDSSGPDFPSLSPDSSVLLKPSTRSLCKHRDSRPSGSCPLEHSLARLLSFTSSSVYLFNCSLLLSTLICNPSIYCQLSLTPQMTFQLKNWSKSKRQALTCNPTLTCTCLSACTCFFSFSRVLATFTSMFSNPSMFPPAWYNPQRKARKALMSTKETQKLGFDTNVHNSKTIMQLSFSKQKTSTSFWLQYASNVM